MLAGVAVTVPSARQVIPLTDSDHPSYPRWRARTTLDRIRGCTRTSLCILIPGWGSGCSIPWTLPHARDIWARLTGSFQRE